MRNSKLAKLSLFFVPGLAAICAFFTNIDNAYFVVPMLYLSYFAVPAIIMSRKYKSFMNTLLCFGLFFVLYIATYIAMKQLYFLTMWSVQTYFILAIMLTLPSAFISRNYLAGWQEMTNMAHVSKKKKKNTFLYFERAEKLTIGLTLSWIVFLLFTVLYCKQFSINDMAILTDNFSDKEKYIEMIPAIISLLFFITMLLITTISFISDLLSAMKKRLLW